MIRITFVELDGSYRGSLRRGSRCDGIDHTCAMIQITFGLSGRENNQSLRLYIPLSIVRCRGVRMERAVVRPRAPS